MAYPVPDTYSCPSGGVIRGGITAIPGLPAWVPGVSGTVASITEANTLTSIQPIDSPANGWAWNLAGAYMGSLQILKIINDFSGGAYNPYFSPSGGSRGCMVFHGGGHSATNWNGIVCFDLTNLQYYIVMDGCLNCYPTDDTVGEYADGQPMSQHTYDNCVILGPEQGYASGALILIGIHGGTPEGRGSTAVHLYDFAHPENKFVRLAGNNASVVHGTGGAAAYDPDLHRVWWVVPANGLGYMPYYDFATSWHQAVSITGTTLSYCHADSMLLRYDTERKLLVLAQTPTDASVRQIWYLRTDNAAAGWKQATLSSAFPSPVGALGFALDKVASNKYLCFTQADTSHIYELTIPAVLTDTWTVTAKTYFGTPLNSSYVIGKRFAYVPSLQSIVCKFTGATAHQIYRV